MNLYGLTDKEVANLTPAQYEWYSCAGDSMIPNDIAKTKAWKGIKMPKKVRIKPIYKGDMYLYASEVFGDE